MAGIMDIENKYTQMQQKYYDTDAKKWTVARPDPVVGGFHRHNAWKDYNIYLFKDNLDEFWVLNGKNVTFILINNENKRSNYE